jgi:hypothetical protein
VHEIEMRQNLGLDQFHGFFGVTRLNVLVAANNGQNFVADVFDQHIGCHILRGSGGKDQQPAQAGKKLFHRSLHN